MTLNLKIMLILAIKIILTIVQDFLRFCSLLNLNKKLFCKDLQGKWNSFLYSALKNTLNPLCRGGGKAAQNGMAGRQGGVKWHGRVAGWCEMAWQDGRAA